VGGFTIKVVNGGSGDAVCKDVFHPADQWFVARPSRVSDLDNLARILKLTSVSY
jgi:hypothetical protein